MVAERRSSPPREYDSIHPPSRPVQTLPPKGGVTDSFDSPRFDPPSILIAFVLALLLSSGAQARLPPQPARGQTEPGNIARGDREVRLLEPGQPLGRELAGGEAHYYRVTLVRGQYLRAAVEQRGVDVVVLLRGPDGVQLAEMDGSSGTPGTEELSWESADSGGHVLEVSAAAEQANRGQYEVRVQTWAEATEQGRARAAAERWYMEGRRAESEGRGAAWERAIKAYEEATGKWREAGEREWEVLTLNHLGTVYWELSRYERARDYFEQALPIAREAKDRRGEGLTLNNLGGVHRSLSQYGQALDYYEQALAIMREIKNRHGEAIILNNLGSVYQSLGRHERARDYFEQALPIMRDVKAKQGEGTTLNHLGNVYRSLSQDDKARDYYEQALLIMGAIGDGSGKALNLYQLASLEGDLGNLSAALRHVESALAITENLRAHYTNQELRSAYFATAQDRYHLYVDLLMRLHRQRPSAGFAAAALQASERARARTLLELLTEARADIRQGVDPQLLERERALQRKLNAGATRQTQLLSRQHTEGQAQAIAKEIEALTAEYQQVQGQIRRSSPRYAALTQFVPLSLGEIQQLLDSETMLLEYAPGEERTYLWAVTQNAINTYELPERAEIEAAARRVYEALSARQPLPGQTAAERKARVAEADARYWHEAARLSQTLLPPAIPRRGMKRLLIVAGGALQFVPFAALPAPQQSVAGGQRSGAGKINRPLTADHRPLILEHEIVNLPSASVLAALRRETTGRKAAAKAVAVLADPVFDQEDERVRLGAQEVKDAAASRPPASDEATSVERAFRDAGALGADGRIARLPFTRREAGRIIAAAPAGEALEALDFKASRATALSAELGRYRVVHFATHGLINTEHPELSGVVLSLIDEGGAPRDGFLRLHEVYNLQLAETELVVLSACQTGLGKEVKGEGLVGLTRGFMYAGAPRVMASLWKVDDAATAELMGQFYQGMLREGLRPPAALRAAQVRMWEQKRWRAPYFWAAFTLQGEWK